MECASFSELASLLEANSAEWDGLRQVGSSHSHSNSHTLSRMDNNNDGAKLKDRRAAIKKKVRRNMEAFFAYINNSNTWRKSQSHHQQKNDMGRQDESGQNRKDSKTDSKTIFTLARLLLPHLDVDRKYGMQETKLLSLLLSTDALYVKLFLFPFFVLYKNRGTKASPSAHNTLKSWKSTSFLMSSSSRLSALKREGLNSLADAAFEAVRGLPTCSNSSTKILQHRSIAYIDSLLTDLANLCSYSDLASTSSSTGMGTNTGNTSSTVQKKIILDLFASASPLEVKWIIHTILKTGSSVSGFTASKYHNADFFYLHCLHWHLVKTYLLCTNLRVACEVVLDPSKRSSEQLGVLISPMAMAKGLSCAHVMDHFSSISLNQKEVAVEVIYFLYTV
jgi:hypothetical protein